MGRRQTTPGVRKFVTPRNRFLIYYIVEEADDELIVLAAGSVSV
jgi:hypothetical protein